MIPSVLSDFKYYSSYKPRKARKKAFLQLIKALRSACSVALSPVTSGCCDKERHKNP